MRIERRFTTEGRDAYDGIEFRKTTSEIRNPDGSVVFQLANVEVPADWSQVACDVLAQKYFRKAGVPVTLEPVAQEGVPSWLWRKKAAAGTDTTGERSAKQVFDRLAGTWTYWGWKGGFFDTESDAQAFFAELRSILPARMGAPNSPQWLNPGRIWPIGSEGPSQGPNYADPLPANLTRPKRPY